MLESKSRTSNILYRFFFAAIFSIFSLVSCGGSQLQDPVTNSEITLTAEPSSIASGQTSNITWASTPSTPCTLSGPGTNNSASTTDKSQGTFPTPALFTATQYTLTCGNTTRSVVVYISSGCVTDETGTAGAISLAMTPSRITGVAPLSVFFDATGTTSTTTATPFHELEYQWEFGDKIGGTQNLSPPVTGSSTWNYGSKANSSNRNVATGPMAAHVYETPGTYYVSLNVTDGSNSASNSCTPITVQDPGVEFSGNNTICFGATTLPVQGVDGCPAQALGVNVSMLSPATFDNAISTYTNPGKRLLFKHDDTFTEASTASIQVTGPGTIGMYGTGAKPIIISTATPAAAGMLRFGAVNVPVLEDWRVMDLEFDGQSKSNLIAVKVGGNADQITLLRLDIHDLHTGLEFDGSVLEYNMTNTHASQHVFDQLTATDSTVNNVTGYGMFIFADHLALLGNQISNAGSHVTRIMHSNKGVVSNSTLSYPSAATCTFTLRAVDYTDHGAGEYFPNLLPGDNAYTENVVVSDNKFVGGLTTQPVTVVPSSTERDGRIRNVILERNWYTVGVAGSDMTSMLSVQAQEVTIRNELMDLTGAAFHTGISVSGAATAAAASNVRIHNNTVFSNSTGNFNLTKIWPGTTNISLVNNLGYAPNSTNPTLNNGEGAPTVNLNNSTDLQMKNSSPLFLATPPTTAAGFYLQAESYAVDNGAAIPVRSDFVGTARPVATKYDIGAYEQ